MVWCVFGLTCERRKIFDKVYSGLFSRFRLGFGLSNGVKRCKMESFGLKWSGRRLTISKIYVLTYGLWEGKAVAVSLSNRERHFMSSFLARVQRGFRIPDPED